MKSFRSVFVLWLVAGSLSLQAQTTKIPFDKIERESQARVNVASTLIASTGSDGSSSSSAIPAAALMTMPRQEAIVPRVVDRSYLLLNGLLLGMAITDIGLTQHCIAEHQCKGTSEELPDPHAWQVMWMQGEDQACGR